VESASRWRRFDVQYALDVTPKAWLGLTALPLQLQEDVLDLLEELTNTPALRVSRGASPDVVRDIVKTYNGALYYIFVLITPDPATRTVRVISIGHIVRP
jgi:hypothetical protein